MQICKYREGNVSQAAMKPAAHSVIWQNCAARIYSLEVTRALGAQQADSTPASKPLCTLSPSNSATSVCSSMSDMLRLNTEACAKVKENAESIRSLASLFSRAFVTSYSGVRLRNVGLPIAACSHVCETSDLVCRHDGPDSNYLIWPIISSLS